MAPLTSGTFVACLLCLWGFVLALGTIKITAEPGQTVTLPCQGHSHAYASAVEWSRTDLWPKWVILRRDQHLDSVKQHPLLMNRAALKDEQMNNGDASLILKNVAVNDTGTYECRVTQERTAEPDTSSVSIIVLDVQPDPDSDRERLLLRIMLFIVVCAPYFLSSLLLVSLWRKRNAGKVITSPPSQRQESLNECGDVIAEHHSCDLSTSGAKLPSAADAVHKKTSAFTA